MRYDFTTVPDRRDGSSMKWSKMYMVKPTVGKDTVPLSTADMEFPTAPEIISGLKAYLDTHTLGYTKATDAYYEAVIYWMKTRHQYSVKREWIMEAAGVVPALCTSIEAYTEPGDGILVLTPIYFPMTMSTLLHERQVVESPLLLTDKGYEIDFEDLEEKAKGENVKLMLFCSPHNPVGRVWTKEELQKVMDICIRNHVFIVDDEIHNDLIMPGYHHTVMATLSEEAAANCAVCTAPSKTFSLAGMQTSNIIIADPVRRAAFQAVKTAGFQLGLNALGYEALRIAYTQCAEWLDECIEVIAENAKYVEKFIAEKFPECRVFPLEGTYLQWVDFNPLKLTYPDLREFMQQEAEIFMDEGYMFGKAGRGFERFNLACPTRVIRSTMGRLAAAYERCRESFETSGKTDHVRLSPSLKMPEFTYSTPYEENKSFAKETKGKKTLVIFSRYYTCILCQRLLSELEEDAELMKKNKISVKVILQSTAENMKKALGETNPYPFEIICDHEERLYHKFEVFPMESMDMLTRPGLKKRMMAMATIKQERAEGNRNQLPAACLIDESGVVTWACYPDTFQGLPEVKQMLSL